MQRVYKGHRRTENDHGGMCAGDAAFENDEEAASREEATDNGDVAEDFLRALADSDITDHPENEVERIMHLAHRKADDWRSTAPGSDGDGYTIDGDQREHTTGQRVVGAGGVGGKHTQTPTTAADRQPDGKKGRLKIDLGPSLADASEGVQVEESARKPRRKGMKRAPKK